MQRKKMTLRFDLDRPEDRQAWEYLQRLDATSMNNSAYCKYFCMVYISTIVLEIGVPVAKLTPRPPVSSSR